MIPFTHQDKKLPGGQRDQGHEVVQHVHREGYQPPHILILLLIKPNKTRRSILGSDGMTKSDCSISL